MPCATLMRTRLGGMPKKTKREKLLAQHHRVSLSPLVSPSLSESSRLPPSPSGFMLPHQSVQMHRTSGVGSIEEFTAIKRDLVKTVIITFGIIISELLLSQYLPH